VHIRALRYGASLEMMKKVGNFDIGELVKSINPEFR
jgi:hypothetical protein